VTSRARPEDAAFATSAVSPAQFPRDGLAEVAFLGRSNVGKSSLLNALTGRKGLARVSGTPGRTQMVNFFRVRPGRGHQELYLVDLPGYGYSKASQSVRRDFERMATSYLIDRSPLGVVVFLVDSRHDPQPADLVLASFLDEHGFPHIIAATKADKIGRSEISKRARSLSAGVGRYARAVVPVSAQTGDGLAELWAAIFEALSDAASSRNEKRP